MFFCNLIIKSKQELKHSLWGNTPFNMFKIDFHIFGQTIIILHTLQQQSGSMNNVSASKVNRKHF